MIEIKPTTIGSLVLHLPCASGSVAKAAGFGERTEGHDFSILQESEFDDFLIALLAARAKVRHAKEKKGDV